MKDMVSGMNHFVEAVTMMVAQSWSSGREWEIDRRVAKELRLPDGETSTVRL